MKKEELEKIEQVCIQIAESIEQLDLHTSLVVYNTINVINNIDKIAAALHRPVKIKCGEWQFWRTVRYKGVVFQQQGFYIRRNR